MRCSINFQSLGTSEIKRKKKPTQTIGQGDRTEKKQNTEQRPTYRPDAKSKQTISAEKAASVTMKLDAPLMQTAVGKCLQEKLCTHET